MKKQLGIGAFYAKLIICGINKLHMAPMWCFWVKLSVNNLLTKVVNISYNSDF